MNDKEHAMIRRSYVPRVSPFDALSRSDIQSLYDHIGTMPFAPRSWSGNWRRVLAEELHRLTEEQQDERHLYVVSDQSAGLSPRELQVLDGIAAGLIGTEIARALFMSRYTVKTHSLRVLEKLAARNRAHAVSNAYKRGILTVPADVKEEAA